MVNIMYTKLPVLTHEGSSPTAQGVGRTKKFDARINVSTTKVKRAEIDAVLEPGEDRLDLIRLAIDKEIASRKARKKS